MNLRKLLILALLIISVFSVFLYPVKKIVIDNVFNPKSIYVINDRLFIAQRTNIYAYSLPEVRFIKTIGSGGAGPNEYRYIINLNSTSNGIRVSDIMKMCFYDPDLKFLREVRFHNLNFIVPFGDQYIGEATINIEKGTDEKKEVRRVNMKRGQAKK
jgi:hypothetical protein